MHLHCSPPFFACLVVFSLLFACPTPLGNGFPAPKNCFPTIKKPFRKFFPSFLRDVVCFQQTRYSIAISPKPEIC